AATLEADGRYEESAAAYQEAIDTAHLDIAPVAVIALGLVRERATEAPEVAPRHLRRLRGDVLALMPEDPGGRVPGADR
ncbi:MAG: hypothetical protein QOG45_196, partial [Chloroflexota bacterium]|nr:hypothetical protein [Chloroflexota bacterium]